MTVSKKDLTDHGDHPNDAHIFSSLIRQRHAYVRSLTSSIPREIHLTFIQNLKHLALSRAYDGLAVNRIEARSIVVVCIVTV